MKCDQLLVEYLKDLTVAGVMSVDQLYSIVVASFLAATGLLYGDFAVILGAMLVSPLGGPLRYMALSLLLGKSHNIILLVVMLVTMSLIAFATGMFAILVNNQLKLFELPTPEMSKLSDSLFLRVNFFLGCLSGIATPYAIKNNNLMLLIGLFISVSILPPMVNGGMFLAMAIQEESPTNREMYYRNCRKSVQISIANWLGLGVSSIVGFWIMC